MPMITIRHDSITEDYAQKKRVRRGGRTIYEEIPMQRPAVTGHYTHYMGDVNLFDQMANCYSFAHQAQRWTKKVVMYLLQLAVQNSYSLYVRHSQDTKKMTLLEYLEMAVESLVFTNR